MSRKDAEKISGQRELYEAVCRIVTSVDLFSMLLTKLRSSCPMSATIEELAELTARYVEELGLDKLEKSQTTDVVLTDILTTFLTCVERMSDGIVHRDAEQQDLWVLDSTDVPMKAHHFDELAQVLAQCDQSARDRQRRADRVIATWNRCGLQDTDVMTSDDDEAVSAASENKHDASKELQMQLSDHESTITALREKIESLGITMQQGRDREDQLKAIADSDREHKESLKDHILDTLENDFGCDDCDLQGCLTLKLGVKTLVRVASETKQRLGSKEEQMQTATPRPKYDKTAAMREAMVQIELANVQPPEKHESTHNFVCNVVELLGKTLEEKQYYQALAENGDKRDGLDGTPKYITAYGIQHNVPCYLRWSGRLPLRPIGRREIQLLIKQVWNEKLHFESSGNPHMPMDEYLHKFLQARVGNAELVASWAYNIIFSLERHRFDGDQVQLFLMILRGEISEQVKCGQQDELEGVQALLSYKFELGDDEIPAGALTEVLSDHFGLAKSEQDLAELQAAALLDAKPAKGSLMIYKPHVVLFAAKDDVERDTHFMICVREQYVHGVQQYTLDMEALLCAAATQGIVDHARGPEECVGGYEAFRAIKELSPHKSDDQVEHYVRVGGNAVGDDEVDVFNETFALQPFLANLKKVELKQYHQA